MFRARGLASLKAGEGEPERETVGSRERSFGTKEASHLALNVILKIKESCQLKI